MLRIMKNQCFQLFCHQVQSHFCYLKQWIIENWIENVKDIPVKEKKQPETKVLEKKEDDDDEINQDE
mgnify:CR=1 FL=1